MNAKHKENFRGKGASFFAGLYGDLARSLFLAEPRVQEARQNKTETRFGLFMGQGSFLHLLSLREVLPPPSAEKCRMLREYFTTVEGAR